MLHDDIPNIPPWVVETIGEWRAKFLATEDAAAWSEEAGRPTRYYMATDKGLWEWRPGTPNELGTLTPWTAIREQPEHIKIPIQELPSAPTTFSDTLTIKQLDLTITCPPVPLDDLDEFAEACQARWAEARAHG